AVHRVRRLDARNIIVESEFELLARGRKPFSWRVPVSFAWDIEATLDGKAIPIAIEPGGIQAEVIIAEAGSHVLRVRRSAAARADEAGAELLRLPINAMPSARIIVEPARDGTPQGELDARGWTE